MKRLFIFLFFIFAFLFVIPSFSSNQVLAQVCTGEETGLPGECGALLFTCGDTGVFDGRDVCGILQQCCVPCGEEGLDCCPDTDSIDPCNSSSLTCDNGTCVDPDASSTAGYIRCSTTCTNIEVTCGDGYRLPDECGGTESGCCYNLGTEIEGSGMTCQEYYECVPEVAETPTPPPPIPTSSAACPVGYFCSYQGNESNCDINAGIFQSCSDAAESSGDCCLPTAGSYTCSWNGAFCYTNLSYICSSGFGHCSDDPNDPSDDQPCTSCEEIGDDYAACTNNAFACVQLNPDAEGYTCAAYPSGCIPCFTSSCAYDKDDFGGSTDEEKLAAALDACILACTGVTSTRFSCDPEKKTCYEDGTGPFEGILSCMSACSGNKQAIFCDPNVENPTRSIEPEAGGIYTAIGCIPMSTTEGFIGFLLSWGVGIAGGIAFIFIIYAGFLVITSSGNPQKVQAGKELLTAAISGLILLIFSAFILEFVGVDILNIPGFGK